MGEGLFFDKKYAWALIFFWLAFLILAAFQPSAYAFLRKKKVARVTPQVDVLAQFPYRIFFKVQPPSDTGVDSTGPSVEVDYKLVNGADVPGPLFENSPGGKVRFLDKDGFVLASDFFLNEDFQKMDFYGSILLDRKRAGEIATADAVPLRDGEAAIVQNERTEKSERRNKEEELFRRALNKSSAPSLSEAQDLKLTVSSVSEVVPSPLPSVSAQSIETNKHPLEKKADPVSSAVSVLLTGGSPDSGSPIPSPQGPQIIIQQAAKEKGAEGVSGGPVVESTKIISAPDLEAAQLPATKGSAGEPQNQVTAPTSQVKIATIDKKKELLDIGGTTNDDIQQSLLLMDKKNATEIPQSPSRIPGISFEDDAAGDAK